jgi:hypothetical protein
VKVFPCQAVGYAAYIKALQGPLGHIPMIPTGGRTLRAQEEAPHRGSPSEFGNDYGTLPGPESVRMIRSYFKSPGRTAVRPYSGPGNPWFRLGFLYVLATPINLKY